MNHETILNRVMNLYEGYNFFYNEKRINYKDVLSITKPIIELILKKAKLTYKFLFNDEFSYRKKRLEGQDGEYIFFDVTEDVFFIIALIIVDIIEEMVASGNKDIHIDKYVR
ncbi:hypothetical protein AVI51_07065 [Piscirickettsia salmonis]|uniref:Uncharacterized protein n=1 Tax=Piscirickettsia salmonis TaxID=1238 RepID=A0A095CQB9_PISSA|nr:hypothetical protein [Piscirickettsia salmonis]RNC78172.1 hypothetical protein DA717_06145 [Piscirickettsiaceae bacterium NZ-RLO2]AKP72747.2 hypothetical protein PSLF89_621 [Piscirickettsia salmonis LF-89 = ATCC VR-1361]ALA25833.1 hypothetical protein KW89_2371 [Piscirickettsia salmonis]ALB23748.1 hypothetical protein KU39_2572 [Piscirickettsia salmonis]ALY03596.1 hypothetical protein AWE47_12680 [Piscirickettsia salmonis]